MSPIPSINRKELRAQIDRIIDAFDFSPFQDEDQRDDVIADRITELIDQYAKAHAREIIGQDEDPDIMERNGYSTAGTNFRNKLRAQQRAKLNQSNQEPQL